MFEANDALAAHPRADPCVYQLSVQPDIHELCESHCEYPRPIATEYTDRIVILIDQETGRGQLLIFITRCRG